MEIDGVVPVRDTLPPAVIAPAEVTVKLADFTILSYPVPTFKALKVLLAIVVTFGRLSAFSVFALLLLLVAPVGVTERPFTVVEVLELFALVKVRLASLEASVVNDESAREKTDPDVAADVIEAVPES